MVHSQRNAMARKLFRRSPVTIGEAVGRDEDLLRVDKSLEKILTTSSTQENLFDLWNKLVLNWLVRTSENG